MIITHNHDRCIGKNVFSVDCAVYIDHAESVYSLVILSEQVKSVNKTALVVTFRNKNYYENI